MFGSHCFIKKHFKIFLEFQTNLLAKKKSENNGNTLQSEATWGYFRAYETKIEVRCMWSLQEFCSLLSFKSLKK